MSNAAAAGGAAQDNAAAADRTAQDNAAAAGRTAQDKTTAAGRTAQGNAAQDRTARDKTTAAGGAAQGRTAQGNAAQDRTAQDKTAQGRTAQGDAAQDRTAQDSVQGNASDCGAATSAGRPLRFGVIGTGMMGAEHIANLAALPGTEVAALCDTWGPSLASAQEQLIGCGLDPVECFDDHRALLDAEVCDAVVVATPNHLHTDVVLDVVDAGVPQLVEKPLATTLEDCRRIVGTLDALGCDAPMVWVGLEYRYMAPVAALIERAHAGAVGPLRMVAVREHRFPFQPKVRDWNRFNRNTGGTLVEKCCHFFDLMRFIVGCRPVRVMASGAQDLNHLDERYDGETPDVLDNAFVIVEFESGTRALLDLCMFADATQHQEELSVVGDSGKLEALLPGSVLRIGVRGRDRIGSVEERSVVSPVPVLGHHHGSSYVEMQRFSDAVRSSAPAECTPMDGLWSVALGRAAHLSIDEGRPVRLSELLTAQELDR